MTEDRAENRTSAHSSSVLSGAGLAAKAKEDLAATLKVRNDVLAAKAAIGKMLADAQRDLAGAVAEAKNLKPESYGDSRYWEERHAKSRERGDTYEWYTGYPEEALQEVK